MTVRHMFCLVLSVAALGLASCGSEPGPSATRRPSVVTTPEARPVAVSACTLLTQEEAAGILGESVEKPTNSAMGGTVSNCNWMTPSLHMVGILVRLSATREEAETVRREAHRQSKSLSGVDPENVAGLGDNAYWAGGNINQLNVFKGNYWLIITASRGKATENLALARAVAEKALGRL